MTRLRTFLVLSVVALLAPAVSAGTLNGTVKLGGISIDETGDRSAVQETYNIFDGFSIQQFSLNGTTDDSDRFLLDLREINLDSRKGSFLYRRPGVFKLSGGYDEYRQVFSPDAAIDAQRRDWRFGGQYSPTRWLDLTASFNRQSRHGDRLSYPLGTLSALGSRYDNVLHMGQLTVQGQRGRVGGAVSYSLSDFSDNLNGAADRTGRVFSLRMNASGFVYDKWTHLFRAAFGERELSATSLAHKLSSFQYTSIVAPLSALEFKYSFDASRVDDESSDLQTDRIQDGFDATYFHKYGQVSGGYVYETNDDDHALTHYNGWRAGTVLHYGKYATAKVNYSERNKKDEEQLTLLKDVESSRLRARLELRPIEALAIGGGYSRRDREFPDIQVEAEGEIATGFARYSLAGWGVVSGDYTYTQDDYDDLVGSFATRSNIVTSRLEFDRLRDVHLACSLTYLDIAGDLDIEKSVFSVEGGYTLQDKYHLDLKYNAYNYDDYVLVDRYYSANVVWFSLGYDFNVK